MRFLALLALPLSAVALTGCGGVSLDAVAKAADTSASQTSEHLEMRATVSTNGQNVSMTGSGDFQNKPALGALTFDVNGSSQTMHEVVSGTTVYLSSSMFGASLPAGKTWMSIDYAKTDKALGIQLPSVTSQSPADTLKTLEASGHVTKIGAETIDGIPTTHYVSTVDPDKLAKLTKALHTTVTYRPIDVWIDSAGLVRRMRMSFSAAGSSSDMTFDLSNYGEAVNVAVPAAAETFDATAAATGALKNGGHS